MAKVACRAVSWYNKEVNLNMVLPSTRLAPPRAVCLKRRHTVDTLSSNTPQNNPHKSNKRPSKVTLCCAFCQKEYSVSKSRAIKAKTHYCSKACFNAGREGGIKQCLTCGKDMYIKRSHFDRAVYCSQECIRKGSKVNCALCGKEVYVRHTRLRQKNYCSKECYKADNDKRTLKSCAYCGKDILVKQCHLTEKNYCSTTCSIKSKRKTIPCLNCGITIETSLSSKRKFCSSACDRAYKVGPRVHNYKGNTIDCTCLFCGASFQKPEAWVKKGEGKFCSISCKSSFTIQKQGGMVSSIEIMVKDVLEQLGENYHHQYGIGKFLVDFYLPERNLVIEADGEYWHSLERGKARDARKNQYMQEKHINIARLKESDIRTSCSELVRMTLSQYPIVKGEYH